MAVRPERPRTPEGGCTDVSEPPRNIDALLSELRSIPTRQAFGSWGVPRGDRVNISLGMIPELPIAMLGCARIGAPHSVVSGGFSAEALRARINDAEARVLITADGPWRRGQVVPLKANAD